MKIGSIMIGPLDALSDQRTELVELLEENAKEIVRLTETAVKYRERLQGFDEAIRVLTERSNHV